METYFILAEKILEIFRLFEQNDQMKALLLIKITNRSLANDLVVIPSPDEDIIDSIFDFVSINHEVYTLILLF